MKAAKITGMIRTLAIATTVVGVVAAASPANAQGLGRRIADAPDGKIRLEFAARPDLCGNGNYVSRGRNNRMSWDSNYSEDVEDTDECIRSPVRLVLYKQGGQLSKIRTYIGGRWRAPVGVVTNLGQVSTHEATDYLMSLASTGSYQPAKDAIFPLTLADSVVVWPGLLKLARDASRPREIRTQSVFWLSQIAGDAVTANLAELTGEAALDREIRKQAVFALSQRRSPEGVTALIQIARTNRDAEIRKNALFWLGQSHDPRALALFEEILARR